MMAELATLVQVGAAGAVVAVVLIFLRFIKERDAEWRSFFTMIRTSDAESSRLLADVIAKLVQRIESLENKFDAHDATEMEFLRGVVARFDRPAGREPRTQPRKPG